MIFAALDIGHWAEQYLVPVILPFLLVMDIVMVNMDRKMMKLALEEERQLENHLTEVKKTTDKLSRRDYELTIGRATVNANERIYCYWHSLHAEEEAGPYEVINKGLSTAKSERGVEVKLVVAKEAERIPAAYELIQRGVQVVFQESLLVSDLRFSLFDENMTVFGIPKSAVDDGSASRFGLDVHNYKLNALLVEYFEDEFDTATSFSEYVASVGCEALKKSAKKKNPKEMVARELGISVEVLEECCSGQLEITEPDPGNAVAAPEGDS